MDENMEKKAPEQPEDNKPEDSKSAAKSPNIAETLVKNGLTKEELEDVLQKTFPKPEENVEESVNKYISSLRKMV